MSGIFLCYRREDTGYGARLLHDRLKGEFGDQVFLDVNDIKGGQDLPKKIKEKLSNTKVFLCLIGKEWLAKGRNGNSRLDDPEDYVRIEIASALKQGDIKVIPILLQDVTMPGKESLPEALHPLCDKAAQEIGHEKDFESNMETLKELIQDELRGSCTPNGQPLEFAAIPCVFRMGSPPTEAGRFNDEELHEVSISPFSITKHPITFEQYDAYVRIKKREDTGDDVKKPYDEGWGRGTRPVINISGSEAMAYAEWLSECTGQKYRLPTEAEWECAARAGTKTPYHFGNTIEDDQANFDNRWEKTREVGKYKPNKWGLYDIHGNVYEWTCSEYNENYDCVTKKWDDPKGQAPNLAIRGGSWKTTETRQLRCAARSQERAYNWRDDLGFRLVLEIKNYEPELNFLESNQPT